MRRRFRSRRSRPVVFARRSFSRRRGGSRRGLNVFGFRIFR